MPAVNEASQHEKPRVLPRRRLNTRAAPRRPSTFLRKLDEPIEGRFSVAASRGRGVSDVERALLERISISSSSSSDSENAVAQPETCIVFQDVPNALSVAAPEVVWADDQQVDEPGKENVCDESILVVSSALEEKARKIMERELMFEKLIAHSKATLEDLEEQMNELGKGYVAIRRSTGSGPPRKKIEIPDLPPSPIDSVNDRSGNDEADENFSKVLKSTPTKSGRPPLAPAPFRADTRKPLLASLARNN